MEERSQETIRTKCILDNNTQNTSTADIRVSEKGAVVMIDCTIGDTSFGNKKDIDLGDGSNAAASILGEGSLTMIVAFTALISSVAAIWVSFSSKKNKVAVLQKSADDNE